MGREQEPEGQELIEKAMAAAVAAVPGAAEDPARPVFHYRAPAQWMNDPNGPIFHRGWYHLFYQFNPYGDQWGHMHWGHARSRDLVNWEDLPVAIWPTKSAGEDHVFSGSTFPDASGTPRIFYTSISGGRPPEQWTATPLDEDLIRWTKPDRNPVVSEATHAPAKIDEWRDPFLFVFEGQTFMLTGGKKDGYGVVVAHRALDEELTQWAYVGILYRHPERGLIECPNIAQIDGKWVLFYYLNGDYVEAHVGALLSPLEFVPERTGRFYDNASASQLVQGEDGQWNYLTWIRMSQHQGWNGCLGLPLALSVDEDAVLRGRPVAALEALRGEVVSLTDHGLDGELDLSADVKGNTLEVELEIAPMEAARIVIALSGAAVATYDVVTGTLTVPHRRPVVLAQTHLKLRLYLDRTVMDVFADDYAQNLNAVVELSESGLKIAAEGGPARIVALNAWEMKPATFDLSRYK